MTAPLIVDAVAIDTNVFLHLLNPQMNSASHINLLLSHLQEMEVSLLVDNGKRISGEYNNQIGPILRKASERGNERFLLDYWIRYAPRRSTEVSWKSELMQAIEKVITERNETVDRIFVYVAFKEGKLLVTNDHKHIISGPQSKKGQGDRRTRLLRSTRKLRCWKADILITQEAHCWFHIS